MPKFIQTDRVAVSDDAGNTVFIRRKMDMGARLRITEAASAGESMVAYYVNNILTWEGPDFRGIKCTPENIEKIDLDDPFWVTVGNRIAELNPNLKEKDPDPLALPSTTDGTPPTTESSPVAADATT